MGSTPARSAILIMKKILATIITLLPLQTYANDCVIIGFRGLKGQFDQSAFEGYAKLKDSYPIVLDYQEVDLALEIIDDNSCYYLYGFSKGAESVIKVLKKVIKNNLPTPHHTLTIGAWHTINVDFRPYNIYFTNYFDSSGVGQKSPGTHVAGVPHSKMQQYVLNVEKQKK